MPASLREFLLKRDEYNPARDSSVKAWYDLSLIASTTSDDIRVDGADNIILLGDQSRHSDENCLVLDGNTGNYPSTADAAYLNTPSGVEVTVRCSLTDWVNVTSQALVSRWDTSSPNRSFMLEILNGFPRLFLSTDGSASAAATCTVVVPFADFSIGLIKATWRVSDGRVQFFTRTSKSAPWVQLGIDRTVVMASIFDSTSVMIVGSYKNGLSAPATGNFYEAEVKDSDGGTTVWAPDFTAQDKLATSFTESSVNAATVTINSTGDTGARICGARDFYMPTASKQRRYLPFNGQKYGFLNGASGAYLNSAAFIPTGGVTRFEVDSTLDDLTPSADQTMLAVYNSTGNQRAWLLNRLITTGSVGFAFSTDGTAAAGITLTATALPDVASTSIAAIVDWDNGTADFEESLDNGETWSALGIQLSFAPAVPFVSSTAGLTVGAYGTGGSVAPLRGKMYGSRIYQDSVLVRSFNAADYPATEGPTLVSSATGETWTVNGKAKIVARTCAFGDGVDDYFKAGAFPLEQPENISMATSMDSWTLNDGLIDGDAGDSGLIYQAGSTPNIGVNAGSDLGSNGGLPVKTTGVLSVVINGAASLSRINHKDPTVGDAGSADMNGLTLGAYGSGATRFANSSDSEIIITGDNPDPNYTQDRKEHYLSRKWRVVDTIEITSLTMDTFAGNPMLTLAGDEIQPF